MKFQGEVRVYNCVDLTALGVVFNQYKKGSWQTGSWVTRTKTGPSSPTQFQMVMSEIRR